VKSASKVLVLAMVIVALLLSGCRSESVPEIVGVWRHWEGFLRAEFTQDGKVIYDVDVEDFPHIDKGTYELLPDDRILIDVASPPRGEFTYKIEGDVLELVADSGERHLFNRIKESGD
jgi:hypothetical protein